MEEEENSYQVFSVFNQGLDRLIADHRNEASEQPSSVEPLDLPPDALFECMQFLQAFDLLVNVSLVSKQFRNAALALIHGESALENPDSDSVVAFIWNEDKRNRQKRYWRAQCESLGLVSPGGSDWFKYFKREYSARLRHRSATIRCDRCRKWLSIAQINNACYPVMDSLETPGGHDISTYLKKAKSIANSRSETPSLLAPPPPPLMPVPPPVTSTQYWNPFIPSTPPTPPPTLPAFPIPVPPPPEIILVPQDLLRNSTQGPTYQLILPPPPPAPPLPVSFPLTHVRRGREIVKNWFRRQFPDYSSPDALN